MLAGYFVAHFQELVLLTYRTISSVRISSEVLPLQQTPTPRGATGWKHITGIVHCETDKPCGTVSDLIWPNGLFKPLPAAVASWATWTSCACHSWPPHPLQAGRSTFP